MEKVIRDGMGAVLVSTGHGAGWSTWNLEYPDCMFNPTMVQWVLDGKTGDVPHVYGVDFYYGGAPKLEVEWVPVGSRFIIDEYDGYESITFEEDFKWLVA